MPAAPDGVIEFAAQRARLFGLAYRLLGSAADAEDVVQDAFLRWDGADHAAVVAPAAWLAKVVTNLCLTRLTSARAGRERYVGTWLPEPVLTSGGALGPLDTAEQRDSVSLALLVLLERLTPTERAVFVLREAFGYRHREIAGVLGISEAGSRQLQRRAASRLGERQPRFRPDRGHRDRLVERFLAAARDGHLPGLERMLAADVTSCADGGGKVRAARRPVTGRERVARLYAGLAARYAAGLRLDAAEVNGQPAVLVRAGDELTAVLAVGVVDGHIAALHVVANPDKLGFLSRQAGGLSRSGGRSGPGR